jgi:hypothetical protein
VPTCARLPDGDERHDDEDDEAHRQAEHHVDREQVSTRSFAIDGVKKEAAGKLMTTLRNLRGNKLASSEAATKAGAVLVKIAVDTSGGPVGIELVERGDAEGTLMRTGGFVYEVTTTQARELQDDVDAALAD